MANQSQSGQGNKAGQPVGSASAPGQQKTYDVTGTGPDGQALPPRTVTQEQWRTEKLGQAGYQKPADLDESAESGAGTTPTT